MKKLYFIALLTLCAFSFASCSKDNDGGQDDKQLEIEGIWSLSRSESSETNLSTGKTVTRDGEYDPLNPTYGSQIFL